MLQILDTNKPPKEIIIDKFNAKSGLSISYDHVELGTVTPIAVPTVNEDTTIEILPTTLAPHLNSFNLSYKRMSLVDIFSAPYLLVPSNTHTTLYELLIDLNNRVGIKLTTDDVDDASIVYTPADPLNPASIFIKAKPGSVFYKGEVTLVLDTELNPPTTEADSASTVFVINKKTPGLDSITAHSFDGFKSKAFSFLRNVDLIVDCKINKIFSCESSLIVLIGTFSLVAPTLPFISPSDVYTTLVMQRDGSIIAARIDDCYLSLVDNEYVAIDTVKKCYYVIDPDQNIAVNPKNVYKLFENGTLDSSFTFDDLEDNVVKIITAKNGFFAISQDNETYTINRYLESTAIDPTFTPVTVLSDKSSIVRISGFSTVNDFNEETLHLYMPNNSNDVQDSPTITATTINEFKSIQQYDYFSPVISIHSNGEVVNASGFLASLNDVNFTQDYKVKSNLLKTLNGSAIYTLNTLNIYKSEVLIPLIVGSDKELIPVTPTGHDVFKITSVNKVYQIASGHETYVTVVYEDHQTNQEFTGILSYDIDHKLNGLILTKPVTDTDLLDITVLRL